MNTRINNIAAKKLLWLAIGLVLLVNAFILGKVYVNRSEVIAQLQLSERELQLPNNYGFTKEDSSARVSLQWTTSNTEPIDINMNQWRWQYDRRLPLNDAHFLSFQFPDCAQKTRLRQKRSAWVLLELNGQSYAEDVAQVEQYHALIMGLTPAQNTEWSEKELSEKRKKADDFLTAAKTENSRLFVIDAAAERGLLETAQRKRQTTANSQLLIVPAELRAGHYRCDNNEKRTTEVLIDNLAVGSLYIPKYFAQNFPQNSDAKLKAKFTAEISYGRLFEPWVSGFISTTEKKQLF
jgi:hypothetical protein